MNAADGVQAVAGQVYVHHGDVRQVLFRQPDRVVRCSRDRDDIDVVGALENVPQRVPEERGGVGDENSQLVGSSGHGVVLSGCAAFNTC